MNDRAAEIRKRLRDDFRFYASKALQIRTKAGEIRSLNLNKAQMILHEAVERQVAEFGYIRVIILKARQQGLSTYVGGRIYHASSHRKGAKALVLAHKADSTRSLFDMVRRYHENVPPFIKPSTRYSSKKELWFDKLDSSYVVATAGGDAVARGETLTHIHASEMAFWPKSSARDIWTGLENACAKVPGTAIFIESTANGVSGLFYDLWMGAVDGTNGYIAVFIPWFIQDLYTLLEADEVAPEPVNFTRNLEEQALAEMAKRDWGVDITDAQLMWRREKIASTSPDAFKQEYPATASEAFLTSGRPVFNPEQLAARLDVAPDPAQCPRMSLGAGGVWENDPRGELIVYRPYEPTESYCIGADVGQGVRGGDYSVAQILDSQKRQVAIWRGHVIPDYFADILSALGQRYNNARLAVENNNHGILTCHRLSREINYENLFYTIQVDKDVDEERRNPGFNTNVRTRPLILDALRAAMRDGEIAVYDKITLREMQTFIVNESGKMEAEEGSHDDCVMSLAIANYAHAGMPKPVELDDSYYVEDGIY